MKVFFFSRHKTCKNNSPAMQVGLKFRTNDNLPIIICCENVMDVILFNTLLNKVFT